jgi:isoaspartyl peptidase/L-asparaginase-like protein (Ntn-hydrolase superfamily)
MMKHEVKPALAIHGGAGAIARAHMTPVRARQYRAALKAALAAGWRVLKTGGASLDAVCAAVVAMEDDPLFNAGRGAALNAAGDAELDASIMDGAALAAGAVAAVQRVRNPILLARAIMEKTPHVLLAGAAADRYARAQGLAMAPAKYFRTLKSEVALARVRHRQSGSESDLHGTVGAVALDCNGNLAAATSTGGYTNKMAGRVGDSAVIGAGTYADNATCAVSCTGHGETFMRAVVAHDIAARMQYGGQSVQRAAMAALRTVERSGVTGGVIAIDRRGAVAIAFNSAGMYRGYVSSGRRPSVAIY